MLSQGDNINNVPLIVAPSRLIVLEDVVAEGDNVRARRIAGAKDNSYVLAQVEVVSAIILTYNCDIDRGLENIAAGHSPDPVEFVAVTAVREMTKELEQKAPLIERGRMPRFALIPATTWNPQLLIDFAALQQMSLRTLTPIAAEKRILSMTGPGQLRLLERFAHSLGDQFRRIGGKDDKEPDRQLFARALRVLQSR